jgi:hypothetical protein
MTEQEMEDTLRELIETAMEEREDEEQELRVESFEEAGILTMNKGLVIETASGAKFQVTIVRSR